MMKNALGLSALLVAAVSLAAISRAQDGSAPGRMATLYSVQFTDKQNGWAIGEGGLILRTANGGESWSEEESPASETLLRLRFNKDGSVGVAAGGRGALVRLVTTENPQRWEKLDSPVQVTLRGVCFADERTIFAVGDRFTLLASTNDGKTWKQVTIELDAPPFLGVAMAEQDGRIVAAQVVRGSPAQKAGLQDGETLVSFDGVRLKSVVDAQRIIASKKIGDEIAIGVVRNAHEQVLKVALGKRSAPSSKTILRCVHFFDAQHGWMCGDSDPEAPSLGGHIFGGKPPSAGVLLRTADGGKTWKPVWIPTNFELSSVWMTSEKVGHIFSHGSATHPDGDTMRLALNEKGEGDFSIARACRGLNDSCFVSAKEGWAVGGAVRVSIVGGNIEANPTYANKPARILHTTDGGKSWQPVNAPDIGGNRELRGVCFVDKDFGCAVGDDGCVLLTRDGGKTWALSRQGRKK